MADAPPKSYPGCALIGLPALLAPLVLFLVGLTGVSLSTLSLFSAGEQLTPQRLSYGGVVDSRMLQPMRDAGAIGAEEIPDAYHSENVIGTAACAISTGRVIRLEGGVFKAIPLTEISKVEGTETSVTIQSDTSNVSLVCPFGVDEGADRFLRMLQHR